MMAIKVRGRYDEVGPIEGEETVAIEAAWIALRQHKGLADNTFGIDVTDIGSRKKTIIATGTQHEPTGVSAPVVERFRIVRVSLSHGATLSC